MFREEIDLRESYEGDLLIENGDLLDTTDNPADTYYQIIRMCLNTGKGECVLFPDFGSSFDQFEGMENSKENGFAAAKLIKKNITDSTTIYASEVDVTPFPIGKHTIAFKLEMKTVDFNHKGLLIAYDTNDNIVRVMNEGKPVNTIIRQIPPTKL